MATVVYIRARTVVDSKQDWDRSEWDQNPPTALENRQTSPREAPARAIPIAFQQDTQAGSPQSPLSVWSDPGAGQASFFCQRGPHWSERLFGIGTDQGQWRHQISFTLPAPREGPAGPGTRCGVRVQCAGVRGVRSLPRNAWRAVGATGGAHLLSNELNN